MSFMDVVNWVVENRESLFEVAVGLLGVASLVTALTKTPKDDAVVAKILKAVERLSVLTHKDTKGTLKAPGTVVDETVD